MSKIERVVVIIFTILLGTTAFATGLEVKNANASKTYLAYQGKPLFAFGPMNELMVFDVKLGSATYNVQRWAQWQAQNGMNYVRCYPTSGIGWSAADSPDYLCPYELLSRKPLRVNLDNFNAEYWHNFHEVLKSLRQHNVIVHLQLIQQCYFETHPDGELRWQMNFFNPNNNINDFTQPVGPNGRGHHSYIEQMVSGNQGLREHYIRYLRHILHSIGDLGNVLIDLSNEMGDGGLDYELAKKWIEFNLDEIEKWEQERGVNLIVGQDYSHFPHPEYLKRHPRMEIIIAHGDDVYHDWTAYNKPVVLVNGADKGGGLRYSNPAHTIRYRKLHWRALMSRVQGVGDYNKDESIAPGSIPHWDLYCRVLRNFFRKLDDYPNLMPANGIIKQAPGKYHYALLSPRQALIYCESGGGTQDIHYDASRLQLTNLGWDDSPAQVQIVKPDSGETKRMAQQVRGGKLGVDLPPFVDDLAILINKEIVAQAD